MAQLPPEYFQREDEASDHDFYRTARKVVHIDDGAIAILRQHYADVLPEDGVILDMMSSWRSHLPENLNAQKIVGLGMNDEEMSDNPQLDEHIVHDLNATPALPYPDQFFDAIVCAVSLQYLIHPVKLFQEVNRVLNPGCIFVVSFSNRCFPSKAIAAWLNMTDRQHLALVMQYFEYAGGWMQIESYAHTSGAHDPLYIVQAKKKVPTF